MNKHIWQTIIIDKPIKIRLILKFNLSIRIVPIGLLFSIVFCFNKFLFLLPLLNLIVLNKSHDIFRFEETIF